MRQKIAQKSQSVIAGSVVALLVGAFFLPIFNTVQPTHAETVGELAHQKEVFQEKLKKLHEEITKDTAKLAGQQKKSSSLQNTISILETKIDKAQNEIQARNIAISQLTNNISDAKVKIDTLTQKIAKAQTSLSSFIREADHNDRHSLVLILLGSKNFSDFFSQVHAYSTLRSDIKTNLDLIKKANIETKGKEEQLQGSKIEQQNLRQIQLLTKRNIEDAQDQKADLLKKSKSKENFYEDTIASKKKQVAQIKAALFRLQGSNKNINFGEALTLAKEVQSYTGVRPAFLLAILTQETRIGQNIGSCNIPGSTPNRMWDDIMPGANDNSWRNDQAAYMRIVKSLGIAPTSRPLSCPQSVGWGGAMGPAQFIPTTWEGLIPAIRKATGSNPPDPWNPRDAFYASGIFLSQLGAGSGTQAGEMEAAGRYFAGGNWATLGRGYALSVENIADRIQTTKIDPIEASEN